MEIIFDIFNFWNTLFSKMMSNFSQPVWKSRKKMSLSKNLHPVGSHSTTTGTKFYTILTPFLLQWTIVDILDDTHHLSHDQAWTFYWPIPPFLVHVVIKWPLDPWRQNSTTEVTLLNNFTVAYFKTFTENWNSKRHFLELSWSI